MRTKCWFHYRRVYEGRIDPASFDIKASSPHDAARTLLFGAPSENVAVDIWQPGETRIHRYYRWEFN